MSLNYTTELRNIFIIENISAKQISLLTTLDVSAQINIKVNIINVTYVRKENGLYNLYISVGETNSKELTIIMEEQFKKNILSLNIPYQIKQAIIVGGFNAVITNVPGIYRRFITQAYEANIPLELITDGTGTFKNEAETTFILVCENPFDVNRLINLINNTNYADFDKISKINNEDVLCIVKSEYEQ